MKRSRSKVVKRIRPKPVAADEGVIDLEKEEASSTPLPFCKVQHYFNSDCSQLEDIPRKRLIKKTYEELYGKPAPRSANLAMVKLACSVRLLYNFYKETGVKIPAVLLQRKEACDQLNFDRLDQPLKSVMQYSMISRKNQPQTEEEGEGNMKSKKTTTTGTTKRKQRNTGKTLGLGIGQTYAYLFEQNEKLPNAKKLTDDQMREFMKKEFPGNDSKSMLNAPAYRRSYNAGVLYSCPKKVTSIPWKGEPKTKAATPATAAAAVSKKVVAKKK